ncbi:7726_t:CDS:2, partial [Dentiscutata heterogama]
HVEKKKVALKSFKNNDMNNGEFIKELKQLHAINIPPNINQFYGITRESSQFITNRNRELIPELDKTIKERSQFYKNMHSDDLSKIFLRTTWFRMPSLPSPKASEDSLPKTSSAPSPHPSPKDSLTK